MDDQSVDLGRVGSVFGYLLGPDAIEGYPAVIHDETDSRPKGVCNLAVGISQTLAFRVGEYGRLKEKSGDRAVTVAAAVLRTLKGGA